MLRGRGLGLGVVEGFGAWGLGLGSVECSLFRFGGKVSGQRGQD